MLIVRRIYDALFPRNAHALEQVGEVLAEHFADVKAKDVARLRDALRDPLGSRFRTIIFVAEEGSGRVRGCAVLLHIADLSVTYLDYVAVRRAEVGSGLGGALYERVREESRLLGARGLFFECLPADPGICRASGLLEQNALRLKFYDRYGVFRIAGTEYETPLKETDDCPPHLMYDDLGMGAPLGRNHGRQVVRAILERKYAGVADEAYIARVEASFRDDPLRLERAWPSRGKPAAARVAPPARKIVLVVNRGHAIHHVKDRGYVEAPVRVATILKEIEPTGLFQERRPRPHRDTIIREVHDLKFLRYLKRLSAGLPAGSSVYPYVFPIRNATRLPVELPIRAGYYCIDTFTPLNHNAWAAARGAVDATLTAAEVVLSGAPVAYALVRPPGHHAESRVFGGFCYLNSSAIAAQMFSHFGRVALLDLDYHHGNGQQEIFYERSDVLTVSIHGHPGFAYPYFTGFADERGSGTGRGYNVNLPLGREVDGAAYRRALERALRRIRAFAPHYLVLSLGLDTAKGDPTGSWLLRGEDFERNGRMIGEMRLPTLVVQEGGYDNRVLGVNARRFFSGLHAAALAAAPSPPQPAAVPAIAVGARGDAAVGKQSPASWKRPAVRRAAGTPSL